MIALVLAAVAAVAPAPAEPAQAAILAAMADSAAGWNAGDLGRFLRVYADDATYVTAKGLVRGKPAIAATYRRSFVAGGNARGRLSFTEASFRPIDPAHLLLWARWTLTGTAVETGMTSLLFERRPEGWRIVADHSS